MTLTRLSQFLAGLLVLANLGFSTGCSALMGQKIKVPTSNLDMDSLKASGYRPGMATAPVQESEDGRPSVILEVHDGKKHLERIPLPSDKPTYIADIVRDAKLIETLGRIDLSIMRPTTENAPPVRMQVDFDTKGKNVMEEQNYSLHSGDHIIVFRNRDSAFDQFVETMVPWSKRFAK